MEAGEYSRAAQRFQWILVQDPEHQGAIDQLAMALVHVYVEEEEIPDPLEPTPTETTQYDPAEAAGLLAQAQSAIDAADWAAALEALTSTRQADPEYETARVDRMLFLALRQFGVQLILERSDLEGGLYRFSLAERFAPLDVDAETVRGWARLYLIGASFWGVLPDRAAFYFGQLADAAPYLADASGIPAIERYFQALVQYGDLLAESGDACGAVDPYGLALARRYDESVEARAAEALEACENPDPEEDPETELSPTPGLTPTPTPTGSGTAAPTESPTAAPETATPEITPTEPPTATSEITPTEPTGDPTPTPGG